MDHGTSRRRLFRHFNMRLVNEIIYENVLVHGDTIKIVKVNRTDIYVSTYINCGNRGFTNKLILYQVSDITSGYWPT